MTILHVLDHSVPVTSGYASRSRSIVRFQARLGLRPVVLTSPKQGTAHDGVEILEGIPHHRTGGRVSRVPGLGELGQMARMAARIAAVATAERARVLHAHSPLLNGLPALWAGRRLGLPVVYEARAFWEDAAVDHGTTRPGSIRYRLTRALESLVFRRADRIVCICEGMRRDIVQRGVDPAQVSVVPNGVDVDWFRPPVSGDRVRQAFGLERAPVLGFIGSFYRYEGLRLLVRAMGALRRRLPEARLLLVGGGEEDDVLRAEAAALGDAVVLAGRVPFDQIREFYSAIDLFVCPRLRMRLTELVTPLKPLEAMAMGRAVLGSDVGGIAELIDDQVTGVLFEAGSSEALVEAATRLVQDDAVRERLGTEARAFAVRERTWERTVAGYLPLYAQLARP